ncbi:MAG: SPOR domain-containing protein [Cellvibrionaceae bacterium]|nr:SPOR domain-containing protein [Cellvibrionaceae bacterium]
MALGKGLLGLLMVLGSWQLRAVPISADLAVEDELLDTAESQSINSAKTEDFNESFCLSAGLLKKYRCDSDTVEAQIEAGQRYSIQLLTSGDAMPQLPEELPVFHRTQLSGQQAFVYVGEFVKQQEALDTMVALVMVGTLEPSVWRPAVVQVDKSREVPGVRLIQMYDDKNYGNLTAKSKEVSTESAATVSIAPTSGAAVMASYYTVQLASFEEQEARNSFVAENKIEELLCRQRRNGRYTAYSGAFETESEARSRLKSLASWIKGAYVLRLKQEDMFSCDGARELRLVSHPDSIAKVSPAHLPYQKSYFTAQIASFASHEKRLQFINNNKQVDFICRTRRNGKFVAYSGVFESRKQLKSYIKNLQRKGVNAYELKLSEEDMFDCSDNDRVVLYSKNRPKVDIVKQPQPSSIAQALAGTTESVMPASSALKKEPSSATKRVSGLQSLSQINLGDSSISQALANKGGGLRPRNPVVQLDVIAPDKNPERKSPSVVEEEATQTPAFYRRQNIELVASSERYAENPEGQLQNQQAEEISANTAELVEEQEVISDTGRLDNLWQPQAGQVFYTVQLATFRGPINEGRFVKQNQDLEPLCRVRRNGQLAVYSGKFLDFENARQYLRSFEAKIDGYVVRLKGELLPPCSI